MDPFFAKLQGFVSLFWLELPWFILLFMVLVLIALLLSVSAFRDLINDRKRLGVFKRICHESLHNVSVPDGIGGNVFVSHILLMSDRIAVIDEKLFEGKIFCDQKVDYWTQTVGQGSYRFQNPLRDLQIQVVAINGLLTHPCAQGFLVFSDDSSFPWGRPDNVYLRKELKDVFKDGKKQLDSTLYQSWSGLLNAGIGERPKKSNKLAYLLSVLVLAIAMAWLFSAWYWSAPAFEQLRAAALS